MSKLSVQEMHTIVDEAIAQYFHPDNMPDDFDEYKPNTLRKIFGAKTTKILAAMSFTAALLTGCVFNTGGIKPPSTDGRADTSVPSDGGVDGGDGGPDPDANVDAGDGGPDSDVDAGPVVENCTVAGDEDNNGLADCADPACDGQQGPGPVLGTCMAEGSTGSSCTDNYDNDGDGLIDCDDPGCYPSGQCPEICDDAIDNNANGDIDCLDASCDGQQGPDGICELGTELTCDDLSDNDVDGLVDCEDSDCFSATCDEICNDGEDNNLNGQTDCAEPSCNLFEDGDIKCVQGRAWERNCLDGVDNDGNGNTDCGDVACQVTAACGYVVEDCTDGADNNGDGRTDCQEAACALEDPCTDWTINCHPLTEGTSGPSGVSGPCSDGTCSQQLGDLPRTFQPPASCN